MGENLITWIVLVVIILFIFDYSRQWVYVSNHSPTECGILGQGFLREAGELLGSLGVAKRKIISGASAGNGIGVVLV